MRQQARPRHALLDRRRRLGGRDHRATFRARVLLAGFFDHVQGGRDVFQPLADFFSDMFQLALALCAAPFLGGQIEYHAPTLKRLRQPLASMSLRCGSGGAAGRF